MNIAAMKKVLDRQYAIEVEHHLSHIDRMTLAMQLMQVESQLDLDKLLSFDDSNFTHDTCGINRHVTVDSNDFTDCFYPRCGK